MKSPALAPRSKVEAVGLDFGTTNSAIAIVGADGSPRLARFSAAEGGDQTETFRSILFFEAVEETGGTDSAVVGRQRRDSPLPRGRGQRPARAIAQVVPRRQDFRIHRHHGRDVHARRFDCANHQRAARRRDCAVRRVAAANRSRPPGSFRRRRQSGRGARAQPAGYRHSARRMDRRGVRVRAGWRRPTTTRFESRATRRC